MEITLVEQPPDCTNLTVSTTGNLLSLTWNNSSTDPEILYRVRTFTSSGNLPQTYESITTKAYTITNNGTIGILEVYAYNTEYTSENPAVYSLGGTGGSGGGGTYEYKPEKQVLGEDTGIYWILVILIVLLCLVIYVKFFNFALVSLVPAKRKFPIQVL